MKAVSVVRLSPPAEQTPHGKRVARPAARPSPERRTQKLVLGKATPAALSEAEARQGGAHFYDSDGFLNFFWRLGPFMEEIRAEAAARARSRG